MTKEAWKAHRIAVGPHPAEGCPECQARLRTKRASASRRWREDALRSCGLVKVRGAVSGRTYWE